MYKKPNNIIQSAILSILFVGILFCSLSAAQDLSPSAWWRLDEGTGTTVIDSSGNHQNGTLYGDPIWTTGIDWGGVYLDGIDDYIEIPNVLTKSATIAFWFKPDWDGTDPEDYRLFDASVEGTFFFIGKGANDDDINPEDFGFYFEDETDWIYENFEIDPKGVIFANTWFHLAVTWEFGGGYPAMYINGKPMLTGPTFSALSDFQTLNSRPRFGLETIDYVPSRNGAMGVIDNIQIFNKALSAEQIESLLAVEVERASDPIPNDEESNVIRDVTLSWTPGIVADSHNVYLSDNFDDVSNADSGSPLLVGPGLNNNSFNPGRLVCGKTYYWRVDEVNAPPDLTVFRGKIWSFTVEPATIAIPTENITATASSYMQGQGPENTINGSGLIDNLHSTFSTDMWVSERSDPGTAWIMYELAKPYKLHEIQVWNYNGKDYLAGLGIKDVVVEHSVDGTNWVPIENVTEFAIAPGADDYAYNTIVPFDDTLAEHVRITAQSNWGGEGFYNLYGLSEVQLMCIPLDARLPDPIDGATDVPIDVTLGWRAGWEAVEHNVYVGTDIQQVIDGSADAVTVSENGYSLASLDLARTYYWRVDEVNNAGTLPIFPGDIWSFTTRDYLVVDDFESYNDIAEGQEGSNLVFLTWIDGYDNPSVNGATMGYFEAYHPSMETAIVHGGGQSAPVMYDNTTASISEVTVNPGDLAIGSDWAKVAPEVLSLWFYGDPNNSTTDQMYVKVNGVKVIDDGGLTLAEWQEFTVDLASLGINLNNVSSLVIGFERIGATGGSGIVFIDDILLLATLE